uniref:Uncharacterized protein n=1 Tax=Hemiselmis andersenii TaxID=464988 RepID=A0A6U4MQP3_HEMAN|mmetsp:Transcript_14547/g.35431  ORF Transcript_14547/g.35431 Transcript_14547/m.35431 type:complete len:136 (+) Transcript_14547:1-408(+)
MVMVMELRDLAVKDEDRRAEALEQERTALEAARERALARYNRMGEAAAQEKGKTGTVVDRAIRARDATVDKEVSRMVDNDVQKRRYINNEVVAHKGERFLYQKVKSKNSVPEDPSSFVGLKIVAKGKRGPSPKFK